MSIKSCTVALAAALAVVGAVPAQAAVDVAPAGLAVDSPDLFFGFFNLQAAINETSLANPSVAPAAARMMGIRDTDFAIVARIAASATAKLEDIRTHETAALSHVAASGRSAVAIRFEAERRRALVSAIGLLKRELAPTSWTALRNYVNGPYLRGIHSQRTVAR